MVTKLTVSVALVTTMILATIHSSTAGLMPRIHVHIMNRMTNNELMLVHCRCSDHDIGYNYVKAGAEFEWWFRRHFLRRTHWRCYLAADKTRFLYLDAYDVGAVSVDSPETEFYWVVREDGVYSRNFSIGQDSFNQGWKTAGILPAPTLPSV